MGIYENQTDSLHELCQTLEVMQNSLSLLKNQSEIDQQQLEDIESYLITLRYAIEEEQVEEEQVCQDKLDCAPAAVVFPSIKRPVDDIYTTSECEADGSSKRAKSSEIKIDDSPVNEEDRALAVPITMFFQTKEKQDQQITFKPTDNTAYTSENLQK